jgi:ABC-type polysaccharide/polyol phosphate transport system ATPase subunit
MVRRAGLGAHSADALAVRGISKSFVLPHQRQTTLKEVFLHPWARTAYERQAALTDVTFSIGQGEFFGIIGSNGSGKSTLLKVIAGIYRQDVGTVHVNGLLSPFIELGVGFNPELSARDNIRINATLLGLGKREIDRRFEEIVAFAELERFVDQKLKNYSSGMQVRLAYSIAIQVEFDILLLDEVLAVGDQSFQEKCMQTFEHFRQQGKTIVLVSHDLNAIQRFSDHVLLLEQGRCIDLGEPEDIIAEYTDRLGVAATV